MKRALVFAANEDVVYSIGEDGKDNGGDEKKDVTFIVERRFFGSTRAQGSRCQKCRITPPKARKSGVDRAICHKFGRGLSCHLAGI